MALKLSVLGIVRSAYSHLAENAGAFGTAAGPWVAFLLFAKLMFAWTGQAGILPVNLGFALDTLLSAGTLSAFAIAWHRHILLADESLGARIDSAMMFRYFARALLVFGGFNIAIFLGPIAAGAFIQSDSNSVAVGLAALAAGATVALLLLGRLCLVFPATALGERRMTFSMSWKFTAGNTWRILAVILLITLPGFALLYATLSGILSGQGASTLYQITAVLAAGTVFLFLWAALGVSASSFVYRTLVLDRQLASFA